METQILNDMIVKLNQSVNELEYSVMQAYDSFLNKYGAGNPYVTRLECYFAAIDKQREFIDQLELCVNNKDYSTIHTISNKIVAISELIKNDARSLLFSIGAGAHNEDVKEETIH